MIKYSGMLLALLASTLGYSPTNPDGPTEADPDCVACEDFGESTCMILLQVEECHGISDEEEIRDHLRECPEEHFGGETGWSFAIGECEPNHWYEPDCIDRDQEALEEAVDALQEAATISDALRSLDAFTEIQGVSVELNQERSALQVLTDGGCNPVPGGKVIEHLPVPKDRIELWKAVLSN